MVVLEVGPAGAFLKEPSDVEPLRKEKQLRVKSEESIQPGLSKGMFSMTALDLLVVVVTAVLLVLALESGFCAEKKSFVVLLVILGLGCLEAACYWKEWETQVLLKCNAVR